MRPAPHPFLDLRPITESPTTGTYSLLKLEPQVAADLLYYYGSSYAPCGKKTLTRFLRRTPTIFSSKDGMK